MHYQKRASRHSWGSRHNALTLKFQGLLKYLRDLDKKTIGKNLALGGIALLLFGSIFFLGAFAWLSKDLPDPNSLTIRDIPLSTKIYDKTGEHLLYEIAGEEKRTLVTLDKIPQFMVQATLTAEDRKFYEHSGIDYKGIIRAMLVNLVTMSKSQGASTITQQLVKNAILTSEKTITRKVKEILLAIALERRYTKDEIMQLYLNEIPYGARNYGVQSASENYFEKDVSTLNLAEAATLAAIPQATTYYVNHPDKLRERRDWILGDMAKLGYITTEEATGAKQTETPLHLDIEGANAIHFVLWVKEQLEEEYSTSDVEQGGLSVVTTLDYDMQKAAEEAVTNNFNARGETHGFNNSSLVAIDPKTGQIRAMVGSRDYDNDDIDGKVNVALSPLQPGSSIKPIIYAAAFEKGYTPNTLLWDTLTTFPSATGPYTPQNYDASERGLVSIRSAIQWSLNIPAVKMTYLIGVDAAISFAERLHYSTLSDRSRFGLSVVLGGAEVTLLDHVAAYGAFAGEGVYRKPVAVLKVTDSKGKALFEHQEEQGETVMDQNIARMMSNVLSDNESRATVFGTNNYLTLGSRPVAAKTGTTSDYNDAWTVGYTPSLVAGVWTGNTDGTAMNRGSGGSNVAAPAWNEFMKNALSSSAIEYFTAPSISKTGKAMLDGETPSKVVVLDRASGKLATDRTPDSYKKEVKCGEYHTILHYVSPSDPLGAVPKDGARDASYATWEQAVQNYIAKYNSKLEAGETPMEACEVPTEEDDLHTKANEPDIKITSPDSGDSAGRSIDIELYSSSPRGVVRIEYQIDGKVVQTTLNDPNATITLPSWVDLGEHTLTAIAYDDIDNSASDEIKIRVTEDGTGARATITNPYNNQEIELTGVPYTLVVELTQASDTTSLVLEALNIWTGASQIIYESSAPASVTTALWTISAPAEYVIFGSVIVGGKTIDIAPVTVMATEAP